MSLSRRTDAQSATSSRLAVVSIASIFVGLSAAVAQQREAKAPPPPPLFQGIIVDTNGKTVGRFYPNIFSAGSNRFQPASNCSHMVVLQIQSTWVALPINDFTVGFTSAYPVGAVTTYYQSSDCTGQPLMYVNQMVQGTNAPAIGVVTAIPPATAP